MPDRRALFFALALPCAIVLAAPIAGCDAPTVGPTVRPLPCERCAAPSRRRPAPAATPPRTEPAALLPGEPSGAPLAPALPIAPPSGPPTWLLTGLISVESHCAAGGPSNPPVYIALSTACGDWSAAYQRRRLLLRPETPQRYALSVPDGTHNLLAMLDCDGDADPLQPRPGAGDVVFFVRPSDAPHKPCRTYRLAGRGTVDVPVTLNTPR